MAQRMLFGNKPQATFQTFLSGMPATDYVFQNTPYREQITRAAKWIKEADYVLIGAGAGLSTAAGLAMGGSRFTDNFKEFIETYGGYYMSDMYSAGFYPFPTEEAKEKGIVTLEEIPTVEEQYGGKRPYADRLSVWQGDITRLSVDAIVNAANSQMLGCFVPCHKCIDNAIHSAAGIQLRQECSQIMKMQGHEERTGNAKITKGYNLPCRYVIHTVGPIVRGNLTGNDCRLLRSCYDSCLELAEAKGLKSIAFCCISTGEFHFPNEAAAEIAVEAVTDFLKNSSLERVIFNVFKEYDRSLYEQLLGGPALPY